MTKRPIEADYNSHVAYTRALEAYCDGLEQPVQEPVAWLMPEGETVLLHTDEWHTTATPLYTAPQAQQPAKEKP